MTDQPGALSGPAPTGEDLIELRGLRVLGHHGASAEERRHAQPFELDLDLVLDLGPAAHSDDLAQTADYGAVLAKIGAVVAQQSYALLEAMAEAVAAAAFSADGRIKAVTVAISKLRPPVPFDVSSVGVRLTRYRRSGPA